MLWKYWQWQCSYGALRAAVYEEVLGKVPMHNLEACSYGAVLLPTGGTSACARTNLIQSFVNLWY